VKGSFGKWSEWSTCSLNNPGFTYNGDSCSCRKRSCNNPPPANGGADCEGSDLEVTNCTQHGQWTSWSDWSACSNTCDLGVRQRRRTCGNPAPAFGGKTCIGQVKVCHSSHLHTCLFAEIYLRNCRYLCFFDISLQSVLVEISICINWTGFF